MYASLLMVVSLSTMQAGGEISIPPGADAPQTLSGSCTSPQPGETTGNFTGVDPWSSPQGANWAPGVDDPFCDRCGGGWWRRGVRCRCLSTCDMFPHYPYFPEYFGYYYFRPYNYVHIFEHQNIVARWGGDPRNPYSHELFQRLYAELPVAAPGRFEAQIPVRRGQLPSLLNLLQKPAEPMPEEIPELPAGE